MGRPASTFEKMFDTVVPIPLIAPMQTTMINASMTAYSVAVGPSSDTKNRFTELSMLTMAHHFLHNFSGFNGLPGHKPHRGTRLSRRHRSLRPSRNAGEGDRMRRISNTLYDSRIPREAVSHNALRS